MERVGGIALDLDVQHVVRPTLGHIGETRDCEIIGGVARGRCDLAGAHTAVDVLGLGLAGAGVGAAAGEPVAVVERMDLLVGEVMHLEIALGGALGVVVVLHHQHIIGGALDVEVDHIDAGIHRLGETEHRGVRCGVLTGGMSEHDRATEGEHTFNR